MRPEQRGGMLGRTTTTQVRLNHENKWRYLKNWWRYLLWWASQREELTVNNVDSDMAHDCGWEFVENKSVRWEDETRRVKSETTSIPCPAAPYMCAPHLVALASVALYRLAAHLHALSAIISAHHTHLPSDVLPLPLHIPIHILQTENRSKSFSNAHSSPFAQRRTPKDLRSSSYSKLIFFWTVSSSNEASANSLI